jgi:hypothetical protein
MKRIVNALSKLRSRQRAYAVLALCAATAMAVRAQTFTTLASFDGADGATRGRPGRRWKLLRDNR